MKKLKIKDLPELLEAIKASDYKIKSSPSVNPTWLIIDKESKLVRFEYGYDAYEYEEVELDFFNSEIDYAEMLEGIVDKDTFVIWQREPFQCLGKTMSTDGCALLAIPILIDKYDVQPNEKLKGIYPTKQTENTELELDKLKQLFSLSPLINETVIETNMVECETCNGQGEVEWEFEHHTKYGDCPVCDGEGEVKKKKKVETGNLICDPDTQFTIDKTTIGISYFNRLILLSEKLKCNPIITSQSESAIKFKIGQCEFLVGRVLTPEHIKPLIYAHNR